MIRKIAVIGNSYKFLNILNSTYPKSIIKVYPWRKLDRTILVKKKNLKKIDIILICGYDYKSHWYPFNRYYFINIIKPFKLIKSLSTSKTKIIYINTVNKLKNKSLQNNIFSWSRYDFAKKELAYKLSKHFKLLKILELPVIEKKNGLANIHGGIFTLFVFNFLIYFKLIKTIKVVRIKKLIKSKITKKNIIVKRSKPVFLNIPRSHFIDRLLRFISE